MAGLPRHHHPTRLSDTIEEIEEDDEDTGMPGKRVFEGGPSVAPGGLVDSYTVTRQGGPVRDVSLLLH